MSTRVWLSDNSNERTKVPGRFKAATADVEPQKNHDSQKDSATIKSIKSIDNAEPIGCHVHSTDLSSIECDKRGEDKKFTSSPALTSPALCPSDSTSESSPSASQWAVAVAQGLPIVSYSPKGCSCCDCSHPCQCPMPCTCLCHGECFCPNSLIQEAEHDLFKPQRETFKASPFASFDSNLKLFAILFSMYSKNQDPSQIAKIIEERFAKHITDFTKSLQNLTTKLLSFACFLSDNVLPNTFKRLGVSMPVIDSNYYYNFRYAGVGFSHYNEFQEKRVLGQGAFGRVVEAYNPLDAMSYAIKIINFHLLLDRNNSLVYEHILNEVRALARLDHPNIVRYYHCWIERNYNIPPSTKKTVSVRLLKDPKDSIVIDEGNELQVSPEGELDEDEVETTIANGKNVYNEWGNDKSDNSSSQDGQIIDDEKDDTIESEIIVWNNDETLVHDEQQSRANSSEKSKNTDKTEDIFKECDGSNSHVSISSHEKGAEYSSGTTPSPVAHFTLYIQMELCTGFTLRDWINGKSIAWFSSCRGCGNALSAKDAEQKMDAELVLKQLSSCSVSIVRQILQGLEHIHSKGLVHRDLKPENIFFVDNKKVKIGDFGLSMIRDDDVEESGYFFEDVELPFENRDINRTAKKSCRQKCQNYTAPYAAPEQLESRNVTDKADIYALGIILYEMYSPFRTSAEQIASINRLKTERVIQGVSMEKHLNVKFWILRMTEPYPERRPSAAKLLERMNMSLYSSCKNLSPPVSLSIPAHSPPSHVNEAPETPQKQEIVRTKPQHGSISSAVSRLTSPSTSGSPIGFIIASPDPFTIKHGEHNTPDEELFEIDVDTCTDIDKLRRYAKKLVEINKGLRKEHSFFKSFEAVDIRYVSPSTIE